MLFSIINRLIPEAFRPVNLARMRYLSFSGSIVQSGPFCGMRYIAESHGSVLAPKVAGTYEQELLPILQTWLKRSPDLLVDVGAAEGYYAVGAVYAKWTPKIVAYEIDPAARRALKALMAINGIEDLSLELRNLCTPNELENLLVAHQRPLAIIDAEGFEALLVDPLRVPSLARCMLLVEYHDFIIAGLKDELVRRMHATHHYEIINPKSRAAEDLKCSDPIIGYLPEAIRGRILDERRPENGNGWLCFSPRAFSGH